MRISQVPLRPLEQKISINPYVPQSQSEYHEEINHGPIGKQSSLDRVRYNIVGK